jgi:hypothetical protein
MKRCAFRRLVSYVLDCILTGRFRAQETALSYVMTTSGVLAVAAADVTSIGSSLGQADAAAAASTTVMIAAAEDEVSAAIASLFSDYGQQYQALSARAAAFMPSLCRR